MGLKNDVADMVPGTSGLSAPKGGFAFWGHQIDCG